MATAHHGGAAGPRLRRSRSLAFVCPITLAAAGCLTRPVSQEAPRTTFVFTTTVNQGGVDKVDLLFMIDDSASMGDKQAYLAQAIPELITRLVTPSCVADDDPTNRVGRADAKGACAQGHVEFPPVHDMHLAIVTSSLGSHGSDECTEPERNKHGRLFARSAASGQPLGDAQPSSFLAWFPSVDANAGVSPSGG